MKVAILGTGSIGRTYAADLTNKQHKTLFWSPTGKGLTAPHCDLTSTGKILAKTQRVPVAATCEEAVTEASTVIFAIDARGLRTTCDALAPHVRDGQVIIFSAHLSLAVLYLSQLLKACGVTATLVVWSTTVLNGQRSGYSTVHISNRRKKVEVATVPARDVNFGLKRCQDLFGDVFTSVPHLGASMLSNFNPPVHTSNLLCNLTRAERGEEWENYGCMTQGVINMVRSLDVERIDLAKDGFACTVRTAEDHWIASFDVTPGTLENMVAELASKRKELFGPDTLKTRFAEEDAPYGLYPLIMIGNKVGKKMERHASFLWMIGTIYGRKFADENDILPLLDVENWSKERLLEELTG